MARSELGSRRSIALASVLDHPPAGLAKHTLDSPMIHVLTRVTDEVFSFLGPATASMVAKGWSQLVIAYDEPGTHRRVQQLDTRVEVRLVPLGGGPVAEWLRLRACVKAALCEQPEIAALHLHGFVSSLLGMSVVRALRFEVPVYFSPHSSYVLGPLRFAARLLMAVLGALGIGERPHPIASLSTDFDRLEGLTRSEISLVESPVSSRFFELVRTESTRATIVAGGQVTAGEEALDMFLRFAVLLRDTEAAPRFVWLGHVSAEQRVRLKATGVGMVDREDEAGRLQLLATAWVYIAPAGGRGVPVGLAEAMASGLACVAAETPFHRDVVMHDRTGLLYRSPAEALDFVARLLDSAELRRTFGAEAREEARRRFDDAKFSHRLEQAYRQSNLATAGSDFTQASGSVVGS
jgi:glycosyltransferase involved in cell wall biosynthesis